MTRIGVGKHLMLGGDNMDLALAHWSKARLRRGRRRARGSRPAARRSWCERCRAAEGTAARRRRARTSDGHAARRAASKLIGGARSARADARGSRALHRRRLLSAVSPDERPARARAAASSNSACRMPATRRSPATSRLPRAARGAGARRRWACLNAGEAPCRCRIRCCSTAACSAPTPWPRGSRRRSAPGAARHCACCTTTNPDVAVARGAVAYALARGGTCAAHRRRLAAQLLPACSTKTASTNARICVLPRGTRRRPRDPARGPHLRAAARGAGALPPGVVGRGHRVSGRRTRRPVRGGGRLRAPAADRHRHRATERAVSAKRPSS